MSIPRRHLRSPMKMGTDISQIKTVAENPIDLVLQARVKMSEKNVNGPDQKMPLLAK